MSNCKQIGIHWNFEKAPLRIGKNILQHYPNDFEIILYCLNVEEDQTTDDVTL